MEVKNAIIKKAVITNGEHGCLSVWLHLDYGCGGQGFGGHNLHNNAFGKDSGNVCGYYIDTILKVVGVYDWGDLQGKTIRVKSDSGKVHSIGNIIKDDWFCPSEDLKQFD